MTELLPKDAGGEKKNAAKRAVHYQPNVWLSRLAHSEAVERELKTFKTTTTASNKTTELPCSRALLGEASYPR